MLHPDRRARSLVLSHFVSLLPLSLRVNAPSSLDTFCRPVNRYRRSSLSSLLSLGGRAGGPLCSRIGDSPSRAAAITIFCRPDNAILPDKEKERGCSLNRSSVLRSFVRPSLRSFVRPPMIVRSSAHPFPRSLSQLVLLVDRRFSTYGRTHADEPCCLGRTQFLPQFRIYLVSHRHVVVSALCRCRFFSKEILLSSCVQDHPLRRYYTSCTKKLGPTLYIVPVSLSLSPSLKNNRMSVEI